MKQSAESSEPWLTIVGVGAGGAEGLSLEARRAIEIAPLVIGNVRQLGLVNNLISGEARTWPSPFATGVAELLARRGQSTCVLASGDPFHFGIGSTLAPHLALGEFRCYPAASSMSLAAARLGWPLQDTTVISLHGRDLHTLISHLHRGRRAIALSWDRDTPAAIAQLLVARGLGNSRIHVLELLGFAGERVRSCVAANFDIGEIDNLNIVAIEFDGEPVLSIPYRAGLPDSAFENDGQLTKREIRAVTLSALAPCPGELLWDVGAGAGSISIEWMLAHPSCRAVAIEEHAERSARIQRNARALGVSSLMVVEASAPDGLAGLPEPDAIFVGGGGGNPLVFETCWDALASGGRLVVNAVSLEGESMLLRWYAEWGGELRRLSVETAVALGSMSGWRPAMPVTQWRITKRK